MQSLGGEFAHQRPPPIEHRCHEVADGFKHLQAHVSTNAFARQQEGEAPKCHPNTRVAVLDSILAWVLLTANRLSWFMWLFGAAGAGKSAIARSVVDLCLERPQDIIVATFFFFRADGTRNTLDNVVATLAFQLIQLLPELHPIVIARLNANSLIFNYSLKDQLRVLIFEPLQQLHLNNPITKMIFLLFDGVDECQGESNQTQFLRILHQFIAEKSIPVIALFLSRPEPPIKAVFYSQEISVNTRNLALDNHYLPDDDIKRYLDDTFAGIKKNHTLKHRLPSDWPSKEAVRTIVRISSGQFVFASVAVGYISDPRSNPATRLEIILGIRPPPGNQEPFAQLDALYRHIMSQVADPPFVLSILATCILRMQRRITSLKHCAELHGIGEEDVEMALVDLTSVVIEIEDDYIIFLHASLPDFLLDSARSGAYYIDRIEWSTRLSIMYLTGRPYPAIWFILDLINEAVPDNKLRDAVLDAHHDIKTLTLDTDSSNTYLVKLSNIDFGDGLGGKVYQQKVFDFARIASTDPESDFFYEILENHDILLSHHHVRQFWTEELPQIKRNHPLRYLLPDNWPGEDLLEQLINHPLRQLSLVCRAGINIAQPRRHPTLQLQAYLSGAILDADSFYRHILSQVSDLYLTQLILATIIMDANTNTFNWGDGYSGYSSRYNLLPEKIRAVAEELSFLVQNLMDHGLPAQFEKFLLDKTRSLDYHIDLDSWGPRIAIIFLTDKRSYFDKLPYLTLIIEYGNRTVELREAILKNTHVVNSSRWHYVHSTVLDYLSILRMKVCILPSTSPYIYLQHLDFGDNGEVYRVVLDYTVRWAHVMESHRMWEKTRILEKIRSNHDIEALLTAIEQENATSLTGMGNDTDVSSTADMDSGPDSSSTSDSEMDTDSDSYYTANDSASEE